MNLNQYALAIHTSSPELGLALSNFAGDDRAQNWQLGQALSTDLHFHLNAFMGLRSWRDLAFIAVAKGPGSFTGTRIGMVTARTLAQQLDLPLFAFSTLATIAWSNALARSNLEDIAVQMPASRGELFVAIYASNKASKTIDAPQASSTVAATRSELTALLPDTVITPQRWEQILQTWDRPYRLILAEANLGAMAVSLLEMAILEWQQGIRPDWSIALPFYGQHPVQP